MGLTYVTVSLKDLAGDGPAYEAEFLVDTGATDCLAPGSALRRIGVREVGRTVYELADGTVQEYPFALARIEFMGEVTAGRVILGPDGAEPLLGVTALESVGITVDPANGTLKRLPAVPLKRRVSDMSYPASARACSRAERSRPMAPEQRARTPVSRRQLAAVTAAAAAGTVLAAACGARGQQAPLRSQQPVKLQLWTFPLTHFQYFTELAPAWKQKAGIEVEPSHITASGGQGWADKYQVAIASDTAPDLVDIEQGPFGRFLRGDVPMVEIGDRLKKEGFWDKLIASRQALYTWKGKNYGVEHALTPVVLYYRRDLFDRVGVRADALKTWDDYVEAGKRMVNDELQFHMYGFDVALRQRGSDYFDEKGDVVADSPLGQQTLGYLADLAQRHRIVNRPLPQGMDFWMGVQSNRYATYVNADWGAGFLKERAPQTRGLWAAVPLPVWAKDAKPRRTSCAGGTGNCVLKSSKYQKEAWETLKFYMLDPGSAARRYEMINLFPPLKDAFKDPRLHVKEEFFGGQDLGRLFQDLAPDVPPQHQHPLRPEVNGIINRAVNAALRGEQSPRDTLKAAGDEARARIKQEGY